MKHIIKYLVLIFTIAVTGCSAPKHYLNTKNIPVQKLATIGTMSNEVRILEIDDKSFDGPQRNDIYIQPGKHKFKVALTWSDFVPVSNGVYINSTTTSPYTRTGCLTLKAGEKYILAASDPSSNWVFSYDKGSAIIIHKTPVPNCE